jgi:cell division protein FtsL
MKKIFKKISKVKDFDNYNEEIRELKGVTFKDVINGKLVTGKLVTKQYRYIILLAAIAFYYIHNHYIVENMQKELYTLNKEVKELRYEALTTSSDLMSMSKPSEVLAKIQQQGIELEELSEPPRILYVSK